jgi:hypothetical protein
MDAVFVAERQIAEQIFEGIDAALGEKLRALRADPFDHADFAGQAECHRYFFISFPLETHGKDDTCATALRNIRVSNSKSEYRGRHWWRKTG